MQLENATNLKESTLKKFRISINPRKIGVVLELVSILLALVGLSVQILFYVAGSSKADWWLPLVNVDKELSIPSLFSVLQFFLLASLLILIGRIKKREKDPSHWYWFAMGVLSFIFSFDEGASIHELATQPLQKLMGQNLPGYLHFAWVIPATMLVVFLVITFFRFYRSLPIRTQALLVLCALVYLGGAVGMEMINGNFADRYGIENLSYNVLVTIEETLEMSGLVLAIYTFLDYLKREYSGVAIRWL